jgi:hypothetical protein
MTMTEGFRELANLPVPGSGGDIRMRVATRNEDGTGAATGWITVTFEQFARIMNIVNEQPERVCSGCRVVVTQDGDLWRGPDGSSYCRPHVWHTAVIL